MKCESCNEREATIAFTRIAGDDKQVLRLCANCAESIARQEKGTGQEMGETQGDSARGAGSAQPATPAQANPDDPGTGEGQTPAETVPEPVDKPPDKKVSVVVGNLSGSDKAVSCPSCGMSYEEFRKVGRFGCAACYAAFAPHLSRLLKRVHGATRHTGRSPAATAVPAPPAAAVAVPGRVPEGLDELREQLGEAVASEAYERAAELRDRIARLEQESGDGTP